MPVPNFSLGSLITLLRKWFNPDREKFTRDSRSPFLKSDVTTFGFTDLDKLPSSVTDALSLSEAKIANKDFATAKQVLINTWLATPSGIASEPAFIRLREGFQKLYIAKGDTARADQIAIMSTLILDQEVQWIVTHPGEEIAGASFDRPNLP